MPEQATKVRLRRFFCKPGNQIFVFTTNNDSGGVVDFMFDTEESPELPRWSYIVQNYLTTTAEFSEFAKGPFATLKEAKHHFEKVVIE